MSQDDGTKGDPGAPLSAAERPKTPFSRARPSERRLLLAEGGHASPHVAWPMLAERQADRMVENVIGVFGLPVGVAVHLLVDGRERRVPMVTEEASVIAAVSAAGKCLRTAGGITTSCQESLLTGQVLLDGVGLAHEAAATITAQASHWRDRANSDCPRLVARGGGVRQVSAEPLPASGTASQVLVHLEVDTCDAMGANLVNGLLEAMKPALLAATNATHAVAILSNLTRRSLVSAEVVVPLASLARRGLTGAEVRDAIVRVARFAESSIERAVTHNKGIMNGVDAVAVATGNDWRAIEANAHAYAGLGLGYRPLSSWTVGPRGELVGRLAMPLKVGTRGGNFAANPGVGANLALLGTTHAVDLARLMAAVGLAQNFAALRALGCEGIQAGHMALHARSVAVSAGLSEERAADIIAKMLAEGTVSVARAKALATERPAASAGPAAERSAPASVGLAHGKVLLFGEHAVVYGAHAVAVPLSLVCRATLRRTASQGVHLSVPAWHIEARLDGQSPVGGVHHSLHLLLSKLGLLRQNMHLLIEPEVPRGVGLGSSAALAVAVIRALNDAFGLALDDVAVEALAFEAEKVAHATPSGVDNALATFARPLVFRRGQPSLLRPLHIARPFLAVIGLAHGHSTTASMVRMVRAAKERHGAMYSQLFEQIDGLSLAGERALAAGDLAEVGQLMNVNHGLLNVMSLSTPEVEELVYAARQAGALGAKMTGGGGGGAVVALAEGDGQAIVEAFGARGFQVLACQVAATPQVAGVARAEDSRSAG